jgi:hypothetical protein
MNNELRMNIEGSGRGLIETVPGVFFFVEGVRKIWD